MKNNFETPPSPFTREEWLNLCCSVSLALQAGDEAVEPARADYYNGIARAGYEALVRVGGQGYLDNLMISHASGGLNES